MSAGPKKESNKDDNVNNSTINRSDCTLFGNNNIITGDNVIVYGNSNQIIGNHAYVVGNKNKIKGQWYRVAGHDNQGEGSCRHSVGMRNKIDLEIISASKEIEMYAAKSKEKKKKSHNPKVSRTEQTYRNDLEKAHVERAKRATVLAEAAEKRLRSSLEPSPSEKEEEEGKDEPEAKSDKLIQAIEGLKDAIFYKIRRTEEQYRIINNKPQDVMLDELFEGETKTEPLQCTVCASSRATVAFKECGHLCLCKACDKAYKYDKCLLCRKEKNKRVRIYM